MADWLEPVVAAGVVMLTEAAGGKFQGLLGDSRVGLRIRQSDGHERRSRLGGNPLQDTAGSELEPGRRGRGKLSVVGGDFAAGDQLIGVVLPHDGTRQGGL